MIFHYNTVHCDILEKVKIGNLRWWYIRIEYLLYDKIMYENVWVMPKILSDHRVIIANEMKSFFKLPKWEICFTLVGSKVYYLIKSHNPHTNPEVTLRAYSKGGENDTETLYEKAQITFAFRRMMCMSNNDDANIIVRKIGNTIELYSLDSFTERKPSSIPDVTFRKWFDLGTRFKKSDDFIPPSRSTLTEATEKLTGIKRPLTLDNDEQDRFNLEIGPILDTLTNIVKSVNKDYVWYISDVYHYIVCTNTP